ncbi:MAG TPA: UvrD-helicase domain-containing protein [Verrucomicrobiae bacterium]|jgi:ATP-dependent helicase/nuclease subunit A
MNPSANFLTPSQQCAVDARGNVLVVAGAGTGKTHTLITRCVDLIQREKVSLDEILIVTFTEAAATEMKRRLRAALEESGDPHSVEQLALFDAAYIGTLHGFCFKLVREHFHELGLDPQLAVLDEAQACLLADETLEDQFNSHYEGQDELSLAAQELIKVYGGGNDEKIRALIRRLHDHMQTRADAEHWLAQQIETFSSAKPIQWREWFIRAISEWRDEWLPVLAHLERENPKAAECRQILGKSKGQELFQKILSTDGKENYPSGKYTVLRGPLKKFFEEAKFLNSLIGAGTKDPLAEDWGWIRDHMTTLLRLAAEFNERFSARKRADGGLDFHDLEQFALQLLWDHKRGRPTETAVWWRARLRYVFVDEYQDINAAQDKIIFALSREDKEANRFLVGDVKQSIYRFRLADPKIFRDYSHDWRGKNGQTIPLTENFRSRESLLGFVNAFFAPLMREETGGVDYDDEAALKFGSPETRAVLGVKKNPEPCAELLLRLKAGRDERADGDDDLADLEESEKEARMLAVRLIEMRTSLHQIWDERAETFRPAEWRDMAILLRSPSGKAEIFAKQFELAGVPLLVERGGFYDSSEVADLLSLLQLLDNPLQDVPLISVLRSPIVGCSLDELAEIRMSSNGKFWFALIQAGAKTKDATTKQKIGKFLERFSRWRKIVKQISLSQCLETILAETHYDDWLLSRLRGMQQRANVRRFVNLAGQFDQFQRQGLFRFLKFVEAQREVDAEPEVAAAMDENAVRLMSIHQSKGLEFPIVAVAGLAKNFNEQDLRGEIILDERFGLCPRVKPPGAGGRYPSLANWLAKRNQRRELRGEEMRLLYVALTRARDTLVLSGTISDKQWGAVDDKSDSITTHEIVSAKSYMDWLALWFRLQPEIKTDAEKGSLPYLRWRFVNDTELAFEGAGARAAVSLSPQRGEGLRVRGESLGGYPSSEIKKKLRDVLEWQYSFDAATKRAAKSSVTALRRTANEGLEDEAQAIFPTATRRSRAKLSAADTGLAHHKFLQHFDFEKAADVESLEKDAQRLEKEKYLTSDERAALKLKNIATFWSSDIGKKIREQAALVRRELPFTARFTPSELDKILGTKSGDMEDEFVVVQGIADLVVLLPKEIWVVDFKTDEVRTADLPEKKKFYAPQLKLYAQALKKIYSRPVTKCWLHFLALGKTEMI